MVQEAASASGVPAHERVSERARRRSLRVSRCRALCGDELMDIFYAKLFETAPAVKPLFARTDLKKQKAMLLGTLVLLRKSLRDLDAIVPKLRELGARRVAYGAQPEHYPVVGQVLIASMAQVTGDAWTNEFEQAWTNAFGIVAGAMIEGAESVQIEEAA